MHRSQENTALRAVQSNRHPKPSISRQRELQTTPIHMRDLCPSAAASRMRAEQTRRCAPHPQGRCAANANPMERKRDASREARMRSTQGKSHPMGITIAHGPGARAALRALWRKHKAAARQTAARTRRRCTRHSFAPLKTSLSSGDSGSWAVRLYRHFPKHGVLIADKPRTN